MALLVPFARRLTQGQNYTAGSRPSNTLGTLVTASSTIHTLGTRVELVASTAYEADWCRITCLNTGVSATLTDQLLNIYIGPQGSETILIANIQSGWSSPVTVGIPVILWFPLRIPRGSRISADLQALISSDNCSVVFEYGFTNGETWAGSGVETLGANTAASRGTAITPGGVSEGSWVSIGTSTQKYHYLLPALMGNNDTTLTAGANSWDVGTGSNVLQEMQDFYSFDSGSEVQSQWLPRGFWCDVASGTALQLRGQNSATPGGLQYATLYGVY